MLAALMRLSPASWGVIVLLAVLIGQSFLHSREVSALTAAVAVAKVELADANAAIAAANKKALEAESDANKKVLEAQNDATKRESALRASAERAAAAADGLRGTVKDLRDRLTGVSNDAAIAHAVAAAGLLDRCSQQYQWLAERADGHVNDIRMLVEAWPRAPDAIAH